MKDSVVGRICSEVCLLNKVTIMTYHSSLVLPNASHDEALI
jgi:hypothetical protein